MGRLSAGGLLCAALGGPARAALIWALCAWAVCGAACQVPPALRCGGVYSVAVAYLPERLDPRLNQDNVYHYMILQLYEPLLRIDAGKVRSAFLDTQRTRSLSRSFDLYRLCLRQDVRFSDGTPVRIEDLAASLTATHGAQEMLPRLDDLRVQGNCVEARLARRDPQYLDKLTTAASTVLKRGTEHDRLPTGLGPYALDRWDDAQVHMTFRGTSPHVDFPEIRFVLVRDLEEALDRGVMDLNLMYWAPRRQAVLADWPKLHHSMMRSYGLIAAIPDPALRKQFVACFDRERYLTEAFSLDVVPSRGFLPTRSPGSDVDFDHIQATLAPTTCYFPGPKPRIRYINRLYADHAALQRFFDSEKDRLPLEVVVEDRTRGGLLDLFNAREPILFTIGIDSVNSQAADLGESSVFFETFIRRNRYIPEVLTDVSLAVHAAAATFDRQKKACHYKEAHQGLLASGYVVPLGQLPPTLYYPACIKEVEFADPVIGYPRIDWVVARRSWWL